MEEPMNIPKSLPNEQPIATKKLTLSEAACNWQAYADRIRNKPGYEALHKNAEQLADWLRELQTLRAAMNTEPRLVHG